jgi:hypothetical protein
MDDNLLRVDLLFLNEIEIDNLLYLTECSFSPISLEVYEGESLDLYVAYMLKKGGI